MAKKNVTLCKSGCKDISVNADAVEAFEAQGWAQADGKQAAPAEKEPSGLSEAEKQMEIDAAGEVARKKGVKAGLTKAEVAADVEAAKSKAEIALQD